MGIFECLIWAAIIGFVTWLATEYIPMPDKVKSLLVVIAIVFIVLLLLSVLGVKTPLRTPHL